MVICMLRQAQLEKKRTRPRLYTDYLEENLIDSEDGIANHKRRHQDHSRDSVKDLQTASEGVDNSFKTRRPHPRSNTNNDRVPSVSKSSCIKNKDVEVEEHHRNLLLSKNKEHMSSECNNIKLAIQNDKSEVVCAMCNQCLITSNHDVCVLNYVNDMNSRADNQKANVSNVANQKKHKPKVKKTKKVESFPFRRQASNWRETLQQDPSQQGRSYNVNRKELTPKIPHNGIYLCSKSKSFRTMSIPPCRRTIDQSAGDVSSTSDCRLVDFENQVQRLMEAYLAPKQPVQVNKITSSYEICSGPHDTQYCMENLEQAFIDYTSSRTDKAGGKWYTFNARANLGLVSNFMASQEARLSKFEADFKQQQGKMTNKIDTIFKATTDRITGALLSDTVKNPKLNVNHTSPVLFARSYLMEDPQCSSHPLNSINAIKTCSKEINHSQKDQLQTVMKIKTQQSEEPELGDSKPFDTLAKLGSRVNIIPLYLFKKLKIGLLEETDHVFRLAVGRGFLAAANTVIDCRKAKITVGEGITRKEFMNCHLPGEWEITRDVEINTFKDVLVFKRMVEFLGALPKNLEGNMWELEDLIENPINWDKPPKNGDGAWHAKIRIIDPDGEEFTKTF
ncbi:hypothetical protein Tco_0580583 [Tanacetum coccineum]